MYLSMYFFFFFLQYTFLLVFIFLLEAMVGTLAYIYEEQVEAELKLNLNTTFLDNYKIDADKTRAIDDMQLQVGLIEYLPPCLFNFTLSLLTIPVIPLLLSLKSLFPLFFFVITFKNFCWLKFFFRLLTN